MEAMKFSLKKKSVPVEMETAEGTTEAYSLVELSGKDRDDYLNAMATKMKYNAKGEPIGIKTFKGLQASLLCLCLEDPNNAKVTQVDLEKYPASVVNELFKAAQKLNALDEEGQEEAKNG